MKKITLVKPFWLFGCLALLLSLTACDNPVNNSKDNDSVNSEPKKYAIWLDRSTYDVFKTTFKRELQDSGFILHEFDTAGWNTVSKSLTDNGKYIWTESRIKLWLLDNKFSEQQSSEIARRIITIEHGLLIFRTGDTVDYLFK